MTLFDHLALGVCAICKQSGEACKCWGEPGEIEAALDDHHECKQQIKELKNENNLLYHQRDEWMKRAKHPSSAWSAYVDNANWLVIVRERLLRRIHKLESHGTQSIDRCCFCQHVEENEI